MKWLQRMIFNSLSAATASRTKIYPAGDVDSSAAPAPAPADRRKRRREAVFVVETLSPFDFALLMSSPSSGYTVTDLPVRIYIVSRCKYIVLRLIKRS